MHGLRSFLRDAVRLRPDLWQSWAALARFRLELNEPAAALLAAGTAVARFPLVPRVWMDRAAVHRVRGDTAAAAEDLRQALAINPRFVEASTQLIDLLESLGDSDAALAELDRAQRLAPRHAPFHAYRAESLWRRGEQQAAIDILVDALRLWPLYGWAWSTLLSWCAVTADAARPRDLARELCATHPGSGVLWQRQSEVTDDVNEKAALLDQALACDPRSTSFLLARCGLLAEQGHVVEARALIDRSFAGGEKPTEILGYEAWLLARTGRRVDAIAAMEKVVAADPAYYRGWQLLAQWYSEERKRDDTLRAARALVRLYPQSPVALVAAAEHFLAQAGDDKALIAEAREYLERALRQQHNDHYLFLTLVDLYFDEGDVAAIRMLFDRHIVDESDIYVRARHVRLLLAEKRVADALDAWVAFLADVPDNDWMLFAPYQWFVDAGEGVGARKRLSPMAADAATAPAIARLWMRAMLDESADQPNRLVADMRKARSAAVPAFWESALAWLVSQRGERTQAASALLYAFGKELPALPRVWPALVYAAIDADNLSEVRRLTTHVFPEAPARALYFCSMAWRAVGNQERARQLAELAVTRPADDSRDNLRFWQEFDAVCHGSGHVRADVLAGLDLRELTRTERLVYDLLLALPLIPEDTTGLSLRALRATVLAVMLSNAGASRNPVARHACLQVKDVFARRDRSSGVLRLWRLLGWQWVFRAPRPAQEAGRAG
jgi:tetratricopeptide (TPR) repeat protein